MKTIQQAVSSLNAFQFSELYHAASEAIAARRNNKHDRYTYTGETGVFYFRWTDAGELHLDKFEERK